ncbi:TonB-dependent receptor domain-containing protein [Erythrobacter litoralis]|uniref:TonB-dependent receptor n=1 Tax=Erythrobacter litoralis (strain HTCC2594) TaxID=314225 RepID=Q2ND61_ERYLH|nr:TonB-dependent receptor [Erythrobacter litoralis]ABC62380.1 TonB-dependent receptor [Erythrobacter litoralis HTCC2594]
MNKNRINSVKGLTLSASIVALAVSGPAFAQTVGTPEPLEGDECALSADGTLPEGCEDEQTPDITSNPEDVVPPEGQIVVTGSRLKRDTFTSISPLQVLQTEQSRDAGLFDPSQILQRSESAAGTQIDATFQGFVLDNGPGSQTLNLRGLGADRTLLLVNGRRLAPAGVEGAPTVPSINLLPGSLIERYDLLLDGASSIYGSDAVAGVGNIILRKDFDGLELFARGEINPEGAGEDYTLSAAWGVNGDRGFFGIGAEYDYRDAVRLRDRDFFSGCDTHREIDESGNLLTLGVADNAVVQNRTPGVSVSESECKIGGISGRIFQPFARFGSVYFPANGNIANFPRDPRTGRPFNFGESTNFFGTDLDSNGDGIRDVDFQNVNTNGANLDQTFLSEQKLFNVMAYGEYTFPSEVNLTPFFEVNYSRAEIFSDNTGFPQLFPSVPDLNPFNPCNFITNPDGVDCRAVDNALQAQAGRPFRPLSTGFPLPTSPIVSVVGDRNNVDIVQEQFRAVVGIRGDAPIFGPSWTFETSLVYSRSEGSSVRRGIREDRLALAIGLDPTADYDGDGVIDNNGNGIADDYDSNLDVFGFFGDPQFIGVCNGAGLANPDAAAPDLNAAGCVPVNLFAPSILGAPIGDFATQAERDYVFGVREFDTTYKQIVWNGFVTGDLFELPGGTAGLVLGGEFRRDEINSQPNLTASDGLLFGFFADRGAIGSKEIQEGFAELDLPLIAGQPGIQELNVNLSGRVTNEEFYGTNFTYSAKIGYRPIEPLLLRASYGTSFRAPNLRENFLLGQSGFLTLFDPCAVPDDAFVGGAYNAATDPRDPVILQNCRREGRDPTVAGVGTNGFNTLQTASVEIVRQGSLDIDPETSTSLTAGFAFEETFGPIDFSLGFNYYRIKLKDSVVEPSSQFILNDCYTRDDGQRSPFCDDIIIDASPTGRFLVEQTTPNFLNLDQEKVEGMDFNLFIGSEVSLFGTLVDLGLTVQANHLMERSTLFIDDTGEETFDDDAGEFSLPKWTGRSTLTADIDNFRVTYQIRYTGPVEQDILGIDEFDDAFGSRGTGFFGDTCTGAGGANFAGDGVFCRDVGFADEQFLHTVSFRYRTGTWTFRAGIDNLFDTAPPLVDGNEVLAIANTAIGNGYDYDGREFFFSVEKSF